MIITKISDGFGNQLFMYACGYAISKRLNKKLFLDITYLDNNNIRSFELDKFNIFYNKLITTRAVKFYVFRVIIRKLIHFFMRSCFSLFKEKYPYVYDNNILKITNNTYIEGYWQCEKYFKDYRVDILNMLTPTFKLSVGCQNYIKRVQKNNSVAIHLRRGDYVNLGLCLDISYYCKAIGKVKNYISNPVFYVFSDDILYAKKIFNEENGFIFVEYKSENSTIEDLLIMKECKNIIIANSTYSWWAAWLNNNPNKIVIYCKDKRNINDFYPNEWISID